MQEPLTPGSFPAAPGAPPNAADHHPRPLVLVPALSEPDRLSHVVDSVLGALDADVLVLDAGGNNFSIPPHTDRVTVLEVPQGVGSAVRRGLEHAVRHGYEVVARVDGDGQHDPALLKDLLSRQQSGSDLVLASRYHPRSAVVAEPPTDRVALNVMFRSLVQQVCGLRLTDVVTGCWVMSRETAAFLAERIRTREYGSTLEMLMLLGLAGRFSVSEVPHPAIYAGLGVEERYTADRRASRCARAGTYLQVVSDVMDRCDANAWPRLIQR
ncbi:glycosyltransferase family 2 protein (plasmid) [Streptomyces anulatus]|uniref:glycosyltransferase family 2 protein n=1 Tax=Streptomyces anulatus TaxID=1892 RepID=UPI002F906FC4|nr:glycosyltransferase family 2 protein [Streptomyces anulatus]